MSKAEKEEFRQSEREVVEGEALALAAFPHLYNPSLRRFNVQLTEDEARTYVHKVHHGNVNDRNAPGGLRRALGKMLTQVDGNLPNRIASLEKAVRFYGDWVDAVAQHDKFRHVIALGPDFGEYKRALAEANAWEDGQEPDEETIRAMGAYRFLEEWSTVFPDRFERFHLTGRLEHIRLLKNIFEIFYEETKGKTAPAKRFGKDFLAEMAGSSKEKTFSEAFAVARIIEDPARVGEVSGRLQHLAPHYAALETDWDIAVLDELPREDQTRSEQVRDVTPYLIRQKGEEKHKKRRAESTKTFLELVHSVSLEQRIDFMEVVDRAITEEGVDPLKLYRKLKRTGLRPEEYAEFLISGDQFSWRPEGSKASIDFLINGSSQEMDPVSTYLMMARANFKILKALEAIAENRTGAPAATELILNPSLLFVDPNAPELVTLARDYQHGRLIIQRYATVRNAGLSDRAEAVLHVGKLRPEIGDLTEIRKGMRALPEEGVRFIPECDTIEEIKRLVKKKSTQKKEMPYHRESFSWFDLMRESLRTKGATTEELALVEKAHKILSNNGGNPRFLRNMFRTQPGDLGQLCEHVITHQENPTFTLVVQRDRLFQRYKYGLATDPDFGENLAGFVVNDYANPFAALREYLPELPLKKAPKKKTTLVEEAPTPMSIEEFPGSIIICGGTFRPKLRKKIERELPGIVFGPDKKRLKKDGVPGLSENDAVLWVVPGSDHSGRDKVKGQCEGQGAIFELSRSDGVRSVVRTIREQILTRGTRT